MFWLNVPNPFLWGTMVALFNFAPYVGAVVSASVLTVVGLSTFDTLGESLAPAAVFLCITIVEGQLITPTILGQRMALSPIFVFLAVIVWGWLWGVAGALMAVPIVTGLKVICDHVPGLAWVGDFVRSDEPRQPRRARRNDSGKGPADTPPAEPPAVRSATAGSSLVRSCQSVRAASRASQRVPLPIRVCAETGHDSRNRFSPRSRGSPL